MKKIINKAFYTITVMALLLAAVLPAQAQFTNTNLETGGLYTFVADGADGVTGGAVIKRQSILPNTTTINATSVTTTSATLNGVVNADGYNANVSFVYGTSPTLTGATTTAATIGATAVSNAGDSNASLNITGLVPATKYYYQVSANNINGTTTGAILNFTTNSAVPVIAYSAPVVLTVGVPCDLAHVNLGGTIPATVYSQVTTTAGNAAAGNTNGTGVAASFNNPFGVTTDAAGNIYLADHSGNLIRKITPGGVVTTLAGSGAAGSANGTGTAASFKNPAGLAADAAGNVYVADYGNNMIRKITPTGVVTTFAGYGPPGSTNGPGTSATFNAPAALVLDASGNLYVADAANNLIRMITPAGVVSTFAGSGSAGSTNGTGTTASFNNPLAITIDLAGNLYVADNTGNRIRKITTPGAIVTTFAGSGTAGSTNASGTAASFKNPAGLATDVAGNVYVGDAGNNMIRKITSDGVVTTLAGALTAGATNGTGTGARFSSPHGVCVSASGLLYVGDFNNNRLRRILVTGYAVAGTLPAGLVLASATGAITGTPTVAKPATDYTVMAYNATGSSATTFSITVNVPLPSPNISYPTPQTYTAGTAISALPPSNSGGAVPATAYSAVGGLYVYLFDSTGLMNMATDASGSVYIADYVANVIRKITPGSFWTTGVTLAGSGVAGNANGTGAAATFYRPAGIAVDAAGNVYVGDSGNNLIRKITPAGVVTTIAGSGVAGSADGTGTAAQFRSPHGVAADGAGNIYVADFTNNKIRKITPGGVVTTLAGSGAAGSVNGTGAAATFNGPISLGADGSGNIYVADYAGNQVRKITPAGVVTTFAGSGAAGSADGTGAAATFKNPYAVTTDGDDNIYIADRGNYNIRKISAAGVVTTLVGKGKAGFANGIGTAASLIDPRGVAFYRGNLYVAQYGDAVVRKVTLTGYTISPALPAGLSFDGATGVITGTPKAASAATNYTVMAYNAAGSDSATINITVNAALQSPNISYASPQTYTSGTAISALSPGNTGGSVPATIYSTVSTLAGSGAAGSANGTGGSATFNGLMNMAIDGAGNVYAADYAGNVIRKITAGGVATTLAGSGVAGNANGTGAAATFHNPAGVAVDGVGNVYVGDSGNNLIRKITPGGVVTTFAGSGAAGSANGTGTGAQFKSPHGVAADGSGNIYVADFSNNLIRKITPGGVVTTLAGNGSAGSANGTGASASFNGPISLGADGAGNLYLADYVNNLIRKITPAGVVTTLAGSGAAGSADGTGVAATFKNPYGVVTDAGNNIYIADRGNNKIRKISPAGVVTTVAGSGVAGSTNGVGTAATFNDPRGVTFYHGNLYVADYIGHQVRKATLTGYTISPALPAGLSFNSATGVITGTPTIASAAANYTVMAYNAAGGAAAVINITVNAMGGASLAQTETPLEEPIAADGPVVKQGMSPNGDGKNDVLVIDNIEKYPDNRLTIMNSAGTTIYQASGYDNTNKVFDGHSNKTRAMQKAGTYFYKLDYKDDKGITNHKTGFILLKY